jgi:FixJ family two-component response regulator
MVLVLHGRLNKQSAGDLGIAETTVKMHRKHMMAKMRAASLVDLIRMTEDLATP